MLQQLGVEEEISEEELQILSAIYTELVDTVIPQFFDLIQGKSDLITINFFEIFSTANLLEAAMQDPEISTQLEGLSEEEIEALMAGMQEARFEGWMQELYGDAEVLDPNYILATANHPAIKLLRGIVPFVKGVNFWLIVLSLATVLLLLLIGRRQGLLGLAITTLIAFIIVAPVTELNKFIVNQALAQTAPFDTIFVPIAESLFQRPRMLWIIYLAVCVISFVLRRVFRKPAQSAEAV